jgi:hypothetical protein
MRQLDIVPAGRTSMKLVLFGFGVAAAFAFPLVLFALTPEPTIAAVEYQEPSPVAPSTVPERAAQSLPSAATADLNVDAELLSAPPPRNGPVQLPDRTIQLGAFSTEQGADDAWEALASSFQEIASLRRMITLESRPAGDIYRLQAAGPTASSTCDRLKAAQVPCMVIT